MSQLEIKINDIPIAVELAVDPSSRNLGLLLKLWKLVSDEVKSPNVKVVFDSADIVIYL